MNQVSIYALINPIDESVFYIGCSIHPQERLTQHIIESRTNNNYKSKIIQAIKKTSNDVELLILDKCDILEATFWEEFYISLFKSYGFTMLQWEKSTYSSAYKDKKFVSQDYGRTTVSICGETANLLNSFTDNRRHRDFLIKVAIEQFVQSNKDAITSNRWGFLKRLKKQYSQYLITHI